MTKQPDKPVVVVEQSRCITVTYNKYGGRYNMPLYLTPEEARLLRAELDNAIQEVSRALP